MNYADLDGMTMGALVPIRESITSVETLNTSRGFELPFEGLNSFVVLSIGRKATMMNAGIDQINYEFPLVVFKNNHLEKLLLELSKKNSFEVPNFCLPSLNNDSV